MSTLKNGLVAYYKLDGNVVDSVAGNNATGFNLSYVAGNIRQAASFNGTNSFAKTSSPINLGTTYSVSWWMKHSAAFAGEPIGGYSTIDKYVAYMTGTNIQHSASFPNTFISIPLATTVNAWNHVVFSRTNLAFTVYLNGAVVYNSLSAFTVNNSLTTGCFGSETGTSWFFNGLLDEAGMWTRAITQAEVTQLYNNGKGLSYPFVQSNFFPFFQ